MRIRESKGFTLIELLIVVAIIGIIAAIAVPGLMRARQSGNETSAIGSMSAINKAEASFAATCANNLYAGDLAHLVAPPTTAPAGSPGYISPDLGTNGVNKAGYTITLTGGTVAVGAVNACNGTAAASLFNGYFATAISNGGGSRDFGTNTTNTIYFQPAGTALGMTENSSAGNPLR